MQEENGGYVEEEARRGEWRQKGGPDVEHKKSHRTVNHKVALKVNKAREERRKTKRLAGR